MIPKLLIALVACLIAATALYAALRALTQCDKCVGVLLASTPLIGWLAALVFALSAATADYPYGCDGWMNPCPEGAGPLSEGLFGVAALLALVTAVMLMTDCAALLYGVIVRGVEWARKLAGRMPRHDARINARTHGRPDGKDE
ncbi:hypothetical protein [Bifidobacterium avesanii]|uniref:Uncharacterized protein n=1 Tax=Bifidobacterium avesanii TaxID=1798157 RepID=A0A7K3TGK9_9BIFI|nr:hypothetical protein [Bifidobacterium avesanii]KAB8287733.1 hypothetical protein DSM100685_1875 [Bifidobacterium avesanii]NEG78192.1 hypothetical protein [Bifidobacterium avesanii]